MKTILTLSLLFIFIQVHSQFVTVNDALSYMGISKIELNTALNSKGYKLTNSKEFDMLEYHKIYSLGEAKVTAAIVNQKVNALSWTLHVGLSHNIISNITSEGFKMIDSKSAEVLLFENANTDLIINVIDKSAISNEVLIILGRKLESKNVKVTKESLQNDYNKLSKKVDVLVGNNSQLTGELGEIKNEIIKLGESIKIQFHKSHIDLNELQSLIDQLKNKMTDFDKEIEKLKRENSQLQ